MLFGHGHRRKRGGAGDLLAGVGVGAALMYFLDPSGGRRRRHQARDRALHAARVAGDSLRKAERDVANRSRGLAARVRQRLRPTEVSDDILVERIRAVLGHVCSHPSLILINARQGCVELTGPVLDYERAAVLARVRVVPGVRTVDDDLDPFVTGEAPRV